MNITNKTRETINTVAKLTLVGLLTIGSYIGGYNVGQKQEINKHKDDEISISIDYEKIPDSHNPTGQRISAFGNLGGEAFGLLDVGNYSTIRNYESHNIPDSVNVDTHFKMLDSIVKVELDKELTKYPYNAKLKTAVDTRYDIRLELKPGKENNKTRAFLEQMYSQFKNGMPNFSAMK